MQDNTSNDKQDTLSAKLEAEAQVIEEQAEALKKEEQAQRSKAVTTTNNTRAGNADLTQQLQHVRGRVSILTALTVLVIAGAAAGGFFLSEQLNKAVVESNAVKTSSQDAADRADKILATFSEQNARISTLLETNDRLKDENLALKSDIAGLASRLDATDKKLSDASLKLSQYEQRNPDDWKLAQAYFLVNSAYQAAVFQADTTSALWCLKDADALLLNMEDQEVVSIRKAIASDLLKLANIPSVDKRGILFKLDSVCENLSSMTLNGMDDSFGAKNKLKQDDGTLTSDIANWQSNLWRAVKDFSSRFIEIRRRDDHALSEFLSSAQEETLRENIRALLLLSKQSLTHSDAASYKSNISQAIDLIKGYYDASSEAARANLATLESIKDLQVVVDVPSVLSSYSAFRELAASRLKVISPSVSSTENTEQTENGSVK